MKRFPVRHASLAVGHRAVALALSCDAPAAPRLRSLTPAQRQRATANVSSSSNITPFSGALRQACAFYSSQTSRVFSTHNGTDPGSNGSSKARANGSGGGAPVPGAASSLSSAATATKPSNSRRSSTTNNTHNKSTRGRKCGGATGAESGSTSLRDDDVLPTPPSPTRRGRRSSSAPLTDLAAAAAAAHVKPIRGRRQTEPPRKRRNARQKASLLVQAHEEQLKEACASHPQADVPTTPEGASAASAPCTKGSASNLAKRPNVTSTGQEKEVRAKNLAGSPRRASPLSGTASKRKAAAASAAAALSTNELLQRVELTSFVERVLNQVRDWATSLKEWAQPSSDPTLREWERQLLLSLRKDSLSDCSAVQYAMQQRYEDQFGRSSHDVAFLTLYARVLVNNAVFCLLNFVTYRATELLTEALKVAESAYTIDKQQQQQQQQQQQNNEDGVNEGAKQGVASGKSTSRGQGGKSSAAAGAKRAKSNSFVSAAPSAASSTAAAVHCVESPEGHLSFLRVLLANAYASDQQYWKAAEQYQLVLSSLERSPLYAPEQLAAGLVSPVLLNHSFVEEDARLFYADHTRVDHAIAQGTAQLLLLQSQGVAANAVPLMHAQLGMARLHRHAGRYTESQSFYESYLDGATDHIEGEDVAGVMLELGRLLLYKVRNEEAALVYLEAGTNMLLEDAQDLLDACGDAPSSATASSCVPAEAAEQVDSVKAATRIAAGNTAQRAAGGLVDTAMALHAQGRTGKAIGLLEGCLQLLDAAGLRLVGGWVREQYADMLATVSLVDRALDEYTKAMHLLRHEGGDHLEQLGAGGRLVSVSASEVEGHLAFCLQTYVGDHKRAMAHYRNVMQGSYRANPLVKSAQAKLSKRARRQRKSAAGERRANSKATSGGPASTVSSIDLALKPDILHWVLSNYVACCERVGAFSEAIGVQNRLIEIEGALGGNVVDSYLKLIALQQQSGEVEKTLALCFYVFYLPDAMMPPHTRLEVANCFASCCHQLGNNRMGAVLMQAVQHVRGDHDASALVHYAMCLKALDPADRLQLDGMMDIEASIHSIGQVFRRAASIVVAETAMDRAEEAEEAATAAAAATAAVAHNKEMAGTTTTSSAASPLDGKEQAASPQQEQQQEQRAPEQSEKAQAASPSPSPATLPAPATASWSHARVERVLNGLIVLSRGAFFFHQNRFLKDAADLYAHALAQVDFVAAAMPVLTDALQREMGILLVNYATLKAADDAKLAATLYERAAAVCPSYMEVAEVVADFFVQAGDYAKGSVYMKRVLRANPSAAAEMHLRLARLGTGPAWDTMSYGQRMEVVEHLLLGLGVSAERIAASCAMMTQRQLSPLAAAEDASKGVVVMSLRDVSQLLMDGVATTMSEEAVCLATYIVQTRFQEPQLLNRMYRRALLRFPQHATILVNYATFCMYAGYHVLARKYIAKAYAASSGDLNCTMCYAQYLSRSYEDQQIGCGEALYSAFLETYPNSARAHAAFANFMAGSMPTPFKTETHFERALQLAPRSEEVVLQYGQFMWACTDTKVVYTNDDVRRRIFDRAEQLFKEAVALNPSSFVACHQLGTFYANRHNRFEEAMTMLYKAHKLQPGNVEVLRHLLSTLHEECVRVQREEQRRSGTVSGQARDAGAAYLSSTSTSSSSRLRTLTSSTQDMFENVLQREPNDRGVLEQYARFAVETLKDASLAASLYSRIQKLNRK